jgi:hypothetical protein
MHVLRIAAAAIIGLFVATAVTGTAEAADNTSPIVGPFPNTEGNMQQVLFTLKKNEISLPMNPQDFCKKLDYGEAVLWDRPDEIKDHTTIGPGNLNWVICRFKNK